MPKGIGYSKEALTGAGAKGKDMTNVSAKMLALQRRKKKIGKDKIS